MTTTPDKQHFDYARFLKTLTHRPGVYRMLGENDTVLYVGKARDLKRRVSSYFNRSLNARLQSMVSQICNVEVTVTHTESEALILENSLIKAHRPRYNVMLKDDKSYPYIYLSSKHRYPRLAFYRGAKKNDGRYFGPFPNVGSTRDTLKLLQKLFPIRQCEDSFFANRSRPCLQYQIKRCTAPCVDLISEDHYARDVEATVLFLEGRTNDVIADRVQKMEQASEQLEFELAARYRDQIQVLNRLQASQYVSGERGNLDIVACVQEGGVNCIQAFVIRGGRNLGNKTFFPKSATLADRAEVVSAFLSQHYSRHNLPSELIVSETLPDVDLLSAAFSQQAGRKIKITSAVRGDRARWLKMALENCEFALRTRISSQVGTSARWRALRETLGLDDSVQRMECFDISHTSGEETVASCVVFDETGPVKSDYRRFNVRDITAGDDYAAMRQALLRRYTRLQKEDGKLPDIIVIDGGKGQLGVAEEVVREVQLTDTMLLGVAKGPDRKPGMEQLFLSGDSQAIILPGNDPALHLIQQIRDEAHRFAIAGHRHKRGKQRQRSMLEDIPGIGQKKRQALLLHFGGMQGIEKAGIEDLQRVSGINHKLATLIYETFHQSV